ncbi:MAG: AAA family ATPase [Alcaligenaceae bacterium]|nr:MAG: AAA family ATPase [Alcaligenaceae bacterium]
MKIRRLDIKNYRGIRDLSWIVPEDHQLLMLVGPGDSTKSTIIDALYLALSERYSLSLSDTDFYLGNVDEPIAIRVTLIELSAEVMKHNVLGMEMGGIKEDGTLTHDPGDGDKTCLTIQLSIDADLEPIWSVYREGGTEPFTQIGVGARKKLSVFKVDERIDGHLRWSRTSALGKLTESEHDTSGTLAAATRASRAAVTKAISAELQTLTGEVQTRMNQLGSGNFKALRPGLDTSVPSSSGLLALYEDQVPLMNYGLGTRRLAGLATQQLAHSGKSILMIDEVEYGLEPHRLVFLLSKLKGSGDIAQAFITTHSPVAIEQMKATDVFVVRSDGAGGVQVHSFSGSPNSAQAVLRSNPSALLARRVFFGEGRTEYGLLLGLMEAWDRERVVLGDTPAVGLGTALADGGGGSTAPVRARMLQGVGYETYVLMDNDDRGVDKAVRQAGRAGVTVIRWSLEKATEAELVESLSSDLLTDLLDIAVQNRVDERTVLHDLNNKLTSGAVLIDLDVDTWVADHEMTIEECRALIASAASEYSWFKNPDQGRNLAAWVLDHELDLDGSEFWAKITEVKAAMYPREPAEGDAEPESDVDG